MAIHNFAAFLKCGRLPKFAGLHTPRRDWIVARDLVLMRVEARDDRSQARTAQTRRNVTVRKGETFASKSIEIGRLNVRMAHEREIAPSLIIRNNQNDIGRRLLGTI